MDRSKLIKNWLKKFLSIVSFLLISLSVGSETHSRAEELFPFGTNDFGIPWKVAEIHRITSPEAMIKRMTHHVWLMKKLGITWVRQHQNTLGNFGWSGIDPDHDGKNLNFTYTDAIVKLAQEYNLLLLPVLSPLPWDKEWLTADSYVPKDKHAYISYIKQIVERYDGDGRDDMPGLKQPIKIWQLENEPDLHHLVRKRRGRANFCSPEEYLEVLKLTYTAIKASDPSAQVMINLVGIQKISGYKGRVSLKYLETLKQLGALDYCDIVSYHIYPPDYSIETLKEFFFSFKKLTGGKPIWITESGINGKWQKTEREQAEWLIKHHVFHIAHGIKKINLLSLDDMSPSVPEGATAKYSGLVTFRRNTPKLSYYTYRRLASALNGSEFKEIISETGGIYIYKLYKNNRFLWIVWNENRESQTIRLKLPAKESQWKLTTLIPPYQSGAELSEEEQAFQRVRGDIKQRKGYHEIVFEVKDEPLLIEATLSEKISVRSLKSLIKSRYSIVWLKGWDFLSLKKPRVQKDLKKS
jgi:GH35 family endo-1,4-beta-xylanase